MEDWVREHVDPLGPFEVISNEPWATVWRVPVEGGAVWAKQCEPMQAFEPRLTADLYRRWPDLLPGVVAADEEHARLLLEDAGMPAIGNPPEAWLAALPPYAELQRAEAVYADEHVAHGVPDLRLASLPERFERLCASDLPLDAHELAALRRLPFASWCAELESAGIAETIQHDDLHPSNLYNRDGRPRLLDWGDASVAHPFFSLVVTFHFLVKTTGLSPGDAWFARLRDAYLEPWGPGLEDVFELAQRVGVVAHAISWLREREYFSAEYRASFDPGFGELLRHALRGGSPLTGW